jgi:hypothetical protein
VGSDWDLSIREETGTRIEMILWTAGGDGIHFDLLHQDNAQGKNQAEEEGLADHMRRLDFGDDFKADSDVEMGGVESGRGQPKGKGKRGRGGNKHQGNANPKPEGTESKGSRWYCPVEGCPKSDMARAAGWASFQGVKDHLEEHTCGRLGGTIPPPWLKNNKLGQCQVCHKVIAARWGKACQKHAPSWRDEEETQEAEGRPVQPGTPSWEQLAAGRIKTKNYVPKGAKQLWAQCLVAALNQVATFNDDKAWRELYMLPKAVLRSAFRAGGKTGKSKGEEETRNRARDWLNGKRGDLWDTGKQDKTKKTQSKEGGDKSGADKKEGGDSERRARAEELAKEGLLSKACQALISEPPVEVDEKVMAEMEKKHPGPGEGEAEKWQH